ncbi:ribosome silencing factor [Saccharibacter sp. 17.LH.SD]|uniref:ribosome silencing factor n=1 Tax=Saccharibacter sp. 17.LH.SD TaxID=2689393 RepID=UPI0013708A6D|nr:ribosome silencing factor [Saccharibacter sp. 17.LH.SD]MXV43675.1 ribosome silencing factor [Saccharibacter sp. 17.LH.SD]
MNTPSLPTPHSQEETVARVLNIAIEKLEEDKAENIVTLNLAGRAGFADHMVIASAVSERQMAAMAHHIERSLKEENLVRVRIEGENDSDWVLIDAGDVVIHLFMPEAREMYALERMWGGDLGHVEEDIVVGQSDAQ